VCANVKPRSLARRPVGGFTCHANGDGISLGQLDWPGRGEGLSDGESEILALITEGKSNAEVAALTYLSPNTVK
jgi:DNA-binding NarL/FixJ family response regulator